MKSAIEMANDLLISEQDVYLTSGDMPKSVLRAIISRIATLSNISPYGGRGRIIVDSRVIEVNIVNTPENQMLELKNPGICGGLFFNRP